MRIIRSLSVVLLAIPVLLLTPPTAIAGGGSPWSDTASGGFVAPAGLRCEFTLTSTVLSDRERIRTLTTYEDGTPRTQKVVGELVVRYTNEETGESVVRNLTGNGIFTWRQDGSLQELTLQGGHFGVGFGAGDEAGPSYLVFTGAGHTVTFDADGSRSVAYGSGPVEDICETLAAA